MLSKESPNNKSQPVGSLSPRNMEKMLPRRFCALTIKCVVLMVKNGSVSIPITMPSETDGTKHGNTGMSLEKVRLMPLEAQSCSDICVFLLVTSTSSENNELRSSNFTELFKFRRHIFQKINYTQSLLLNTIIIILHNLRSCR